jgi:hypothetical protein
MEEKIKSEEDSKKSVLTTEGSRKVCVKQQCWLSDYSSFSKELGLCSLRQSP